MKKVACGLLIIVGMVAFIGICILSMGTLQKFFLGLDHKETADVPGDASKFDPIASYGAIKNFSGDNSHLYSFKAEYVKSDGTMELTANYTPSPNAEYEFYKETTAPQNAPPAGVGNSSSGKWYLPVTIELLKPGKFFHVQSIGGGVSTTYDYTTKGMDKSTGTALSANEDQLLSDPKCSFKSLWDVALTKGADKNAVAIIEYDKSGYSFEITGSNISLQFNKDCKLTDQ